MLEDYYELKFKYGDYIIFFKKGNFNYCIKEDSYIINYLFNYKLINDKVSFPYNGIDKIINRLNIDNIGFIIYDGIILDKVIGDSNNYAILLNDSYKYIARSKVIVEINNKIKDYTLDELSNLVSII